ECPSPIQDEYQAAQQKHDAEAESADAALADVIVNAPHADVERQADADDHEDDVEDFQGHTSPCHPERSEGPGERAARHLPPGSLATLGMTSIRTYPRHRALVTTATLQKMRR